MSRGAKHGSEGSAPSAIAPNLTMATNRKTTYEAFETSSVANRRTLRQEELIVAMTETLSGMLEREKITKTELARRLGKTKAFVGEILSGETNLTLRTIADVADALGYRLKLDAVKARTKKGSALRESA